jgi:hypothetical protein
MPKEKGADWKMYAWKVIKKGMKSDNGNITWKKDQWREHEGDVKICNSGFHASDKLIDAIRYVTPGIICRVEYDDIVDKEDDKFVCRKMRVIKTYKFTKKMAVELAIFSAKLCLKNFEKKYPRDNRPREAIQAAENYLKNPSNKTRSAESAARSAWSAAGSAARSAWSAARSAARSAGSAARSAWSAWSAARSAARSAWSAARSAAWSAESAARSAAWSAWSAESAASSAESAAWSAESAAWSAESAASSAAWSAGSAARSAAGSAIEKKLLKIIGYKKGADGKWNI